MKSNVARFTIHVQTCLETNQVVASHEDTDFEFWLVNITLESRHIWELGELLQNQFALSRPVKRAACRDFVAKSRTTLYFLHFFRNLQQFDFLQNRFFYSWVVKMPNIAFSCTFRFCCLFHRSLLQKFKNMLTLIRRLLRSCRWWYNGDRRGLKKDHQISYQ